MTEKNNPASVQNVDGAIVGRHSVRRFLSREVSRETVVRLLELGAKAPSGTNVQPWKVYVLTGEAKDALSKAIVKKFDAGEKEAREYDYYPKVWEEPWLSRRRSVGVGLYGLLGISKDDSEGMKRQTTRNFLFFDAPIGLIFTMDRRFGIGMFMDVGMFMENVMIGARARGLDTCPQAFFADYPDTIRTCLGIGQNEVIVCGMALGYADPDAPENALETDRESIENFAVFRGF
ncbi:MAG: nitroreductase [Holophagales bacterium]|jgi:nitroreductase|nr:nitroreductase [Holophagales bacterium]